MDPMVIFVNVIGWIGMLLLVGAYFLVTMSRIRPTGATFPVMNLIGGLFLCVNTAWYGAWPSTGLNVVWICVGTVGLIRYWLHKSSASRESTG